MPYVQLYSRPLQLEQKRVIAEKLIEITLRTFRLRPDQRHQTSIQFVTLPQERRVNGLQLLISRQSEFTLEVLGHNLTEEKKSAFAREAAAMLADLVPPGPWTRIARVFAPSAGRRRAVTLQFHELYPAISEPYVLHSERLVA